MKKLLFFIAVFCCLQSGFASDVLDVTSQYLQNYTTPFATTGETINAGNTRWTKLAAPWITENDYTDAAGVITTWHIDGQKKTQHTFPADPATYGTGRVGPMTITPGWDGFAGTISNVKVYQTVTLPAGNFEVFVQKAQDWSGAAGVYLVVNSGAGLPNIENLSTAIGSSKLSNGTSTNSYVVSVPFTLAQETQVSIGCVASYTSAKLSVTIAQFVLQQIVGANYNSLTSLLTVAKGYTADTYPIGTVYGTYPQDKWDALQAAITASQALVDNGQNTQEEVDAQVVSLKTAINNLNGSIKIPFEISDDNNTQWYQIRDKRNPMNYWTIGQYTSTDGVRDYPLALIMTNDSDATSDAQLFKIVKAPAPSTGYYLYNKLLEDFPICGSLKHNMALIDIDGSLGLTATAWQFGATAYGTHYRIFLEGDITSQLNSYKNQSPNFWGFWYPGQGKDDLGNDMELVAVKVEGKTDFSALHTLVTTAVLMTADKYPTGTAEYEFSKEKWDNFVIIRSSAVDFDTTMVKVSTTTQTAVDSVYNVLNTAITELKASQNPGFFTSNATTDYWYTLSDNRTPSSYMKIGDWKLPADTVYQHNRLILVNGVPAVINDSVLFRLVKAPEPLTGYYIYSKLNSATPLFGDSLAANNLVKIDETIPVETWTSWTFTPGTSFAKSYIIAIEGASTKQLNSYTSKTPSYIAFWTNVSDPGNNWVLTRHIETGFNNVTSKEADIDVLVLNNRIVSRNSNDRLKVYNVCGQRLNPNQQLSAGLYIVCIEGKIGSRKVLVK